MRTQRELQLYYWGPHFDMVNAYNKKYGCNVKPYECIKYKGTVSNRICDFSKNHNLYEFALTILYDDKRKEHRPVFAGDRLYLNGDEFVVWGRELIHQDRFSWNPPIPKRTFKLGDLESTCPLKRHEISGLADSSTHLVEIHCGEFVSKFEYVSEEDAANLYAAILDILTEALDKE